MCYSIYQGYVTSRMFLGNNKEAVEQPLRPLKY